MTSGCLRHKRDVSCHILRVHTDPYSRLEGQCIKLPFSHSRAHHNLPGLALIARATALYFFAKHIFKAGALPARRWKVHVWIACTLCSHRWSNIVLTSRWLPDIVSAAWTRWTLGSKGTSRESAVQLRVDHKSPAGARVQITNPDSNVSARQESGGWGFYTCCMFCQFVNIFRNIH